MIGAHLRQPPACPSHPHREAESRCARCFVHYCGQCLEDADGRLLCPRCRDEAAALAQIQQDARLTPGNLFRRVARRSVLIGVVVTFLIVAGLGALVTAFWRTAGTEVDFSLIRRIRAGFTQSFNLGEEGFDFVEVLNEGLVRPGSQSRDPLHSLERINDGLPDAQVPAWRSGDVNLPIDLLFVSNSPRLMGKVVIWNHPGEDPSTYIKGFEVFTSPVDPDVDESGLALVGTFQAEQTTEIQRFEFDPPVPTQYTLVRVTSHYGNADYISAAEIGLFLPGARGAFPILPQQFPVIRARRAQFR